MKERLITNGVLSIINTVTTIFLFYYIGWSNYFLNIWTFSGLYVIRFILLITNIVMGIVTLSMKKHIAAKGLTIASGIIAILNSLLFVNAIVSFIGVAKINNYRK